MHTEINQLYLSRQLAHAYASVAKFFMPDIVFDKEFGLIAKVVDLDDAEFTKVLIEHNVYSEAEGTNGLKMMASVRPVDDFGPVCGHVAINGFTIIKKIPDPRVRQAVNSSIIEWTFRGPP